jgi:hypothetical protein
MILNGAAVGDITNLVVQGPSMVQNDDHDGKEAGASQECHGAKEVNSYNEKPR